MNRIDERFAKVKADGRKALITFLTVGDPNIEVSEKAIYTMQEEGVDLIELGVPFSDPAADGPVIQRADERALAQGVDIFKVFELVRKIRNNVEVPMVFLLYYNVMVQYGIEKFFKRCQETGVDGLIIPDLPYEESDEIKGILVILNTVGGDVEAGLAMAELINSISKKVVTLVLGGSHSIGVPLATAGDYSFIAPTATMVVHPIRTNGLVIGVNETFEYFKKMQERITQFIIRTSNIEREELEKIMHSKEDLVSDVGSVLIGKEAVECGLINEVGGLKDAMNKLKELIKESNNK